MLAAEHTACLTESCRVPCKGLYLFFLFFGLAMLGLILVIGSTRLWTEGRLPKLLLLARAHSVSPSRILQKVAARR